MDASTPRAASHRFQCPTCASFNVRPLPNSGNEALLLCVRCHETFVLDNGTPRKTTPNRPIEPGRSGT
jgi:transposase-like protein